jgi:hypothetical protein
VEEAIVGIPYQATTAEDIACAVMNSGVRKFATALELIVVMLLKSPINPITNPNPLSSH